MRLIIIFTFVLLLALVSLTFLSREFLTPAKTEKQPTRVVVEQGMGASAIGKLLGQKGLIRHAWSFSLLVRLTKTSQKIKAGTYDISPSQSAYAILQGLVKGESVLVRIIIPEGYTSKQIAALLGSKGVTSEIDFLEKVADTQITFPEIHQTIQGLEGFLFPDTYDFAPNLTPEHVYDFMIKRFREMVLPVYLNTDKKMSLKNTITLASMIERETRLRKEYPLVSAVYYNRLKLGLPLQCDATIQYLLPTPKELLTAKDLDIKSPYNTYLHPGLPPGPIGSPGLASIKAALKPAHVPYLYYVVRGNGGHTFSVTYAQHEEAVQHYRNWLRYRSKPVK